MRILATLLLAIVLPAVIFAKKTEPRFETFRVKVWSGKPAPLNLTSHPLARKFRTSLREQIREEGVNFAGHYTLAAMGCGTGCSITAIVDARNGRAYFPQVFEGWTSIIGDYQFAEGEDIRMFKPNSRLMRAIGRPRLGVDERWGPSGIYYYAWVNNQLKQVHFVPTGSYPEKIVLKTEVQPDYSTMPSGHLIRRGAVRYLQVTREILAPQTMRWHKVKHGHVSLRRFP